MVAPRLEMNRDDVTMATQLRFRFELDNLADIQPWGEPGTANLHWFGLTSGRYWIETPVGEVLRYTDQIRKVWNLPFSHVDYQVARIFEDLQAHLPHILEPVPDDIARIASNRAWLASANSWREEDSDKQEIDGRWDLYNAALAWWHERELDTAYLSHGPWLSIWRTGEETHFRWTTPCNEDHGTSVFVVPNGCFTLTSADFEAAAYGFCEDVLRAMSARIDQIHRDGWKRAECSLNVDVLIAEHQHRDRLFAELKGQRPGTDWNTIRTDLQNLIARVGCG
ncbi:MAG: hypothetical protein IT168_24440 [Bryobacterales bacterium]|nr:hypothetical protein [Bryobacterales bacterium]